MNRPSRRHHAGQDRRRTRVLLLLGLLGNSAAAIAFFASGLILPGLLATVAGLGTVVAAAWHARPGNWPPADRES